MANIKLHNHFLFVVCIFFNLTRYFFVGGQRNEKIWDLMRCFRHARVFRSTASSRINLSSPNAQCTVVHKGIKIVRMGCLHQGEIKRRSLTWYTAQSLCPPFAKVGLYCIGVVTGPLLQIKIFLLSFIVSTQLQRHGNVKVGSGELFLLSLSGILYWV